MKQTKTARYQALQAALVAAVRVGNVAQAAHIRAELAILRQS